MITLHFVQPKFNQLVLNYSKIIGSIVPFNFIIEFYQTVKARWKFLIESFGTAASRTARAARRRALPAVTPQIGPNEHKMCGKH